MDAAGWIRVSTGKQDEKSQIPDIEKFAAHHGHRIVKWYELNDFSAYKGEQEEMQRQVIADAWKGDWQLLIVWHSDRLERRGIEALLSFARRLREAKATVASVLEPWISGSDAMSEMFIAMSATQARMNSARKSEDILRGMQVRRDKIAAGVPVKGRQAMGGRVAGSKNRKERPDKGKKSRSWTPQRRAALIARNKARAASDTAA